MRITTELWHDPAGGKRRPGAGRFDLEKTHGTVSPSVDDARATCRVCSAVRHRTGLTISVRLEP
jgi:hypothetical protein